MFTLLNRSQSATPVFHETDSLLFSARNTAVPPPHVVSRFELESQAFSILNSNVSIPHGTSNQEAESVAFMLRNDSQAAARSSFEVETSSFSVLNTAFGSPGVTSFEIESTEFSVRNKISPPSPGGQRLETESLLFTLLNSTQSVRGIFQEADSPRFSILNSNASTSPASSFEANSNLFSLLNGAPAPSHTFEADSARFTVRNTVVISSARRSVVVQARSRKRDRRPARRQVPGAAFSTTSSHMATSSVAPVSVNEQPSRTSSSGPNSEAAGTAQGKSTSSSNEQRSQHVSPTLENQQ